jgi:hypothetical protein
LVVIIKAKNWKPFFGVTHKDLLYHTKWTVAAK